ncbi:MAG: aminoacyl-tRNA hydrolase [Alphaproteobacteria bacterium]
MTEKNIPHIQWLVGLGNPGQDYHRHRHNIGFRLLDEIYQQGDFSNWQFGSQKKFATAKGMLSSHHLWLIKPLGYVNLSGKILQSIIARAQEKITLANIMVLHDDIALDFAKIKIKFDGGDAGHNGLKDISECLGKNYGRLRFGVGHPGAKHLVSDFVLQDFSNHEEKILSPLIPVIAKYFHHILDHHNGIFLQHYHVEKKIILDHQHTNEK